MPNLWSSGCVRHTSCLGVGSPLIGSSLAPPIPNSASSVFRRKRSSCPMAPQFWLSKGRATQQFPGRIWPRTARTARVFPKSNHQTLHYRDVILELGGWSNALRARSPRKHTFLRTLPACRRQYHPSSMATSLSHARSSYSIATNGDQSFSCKVKLLHSDRQQSCTCTDWRENKIALRHFHDLVGIKVLRETEPQR